MVESLCYVCNFKNLKLFHLIAYVPIYFCRCQTGATMCLWTEKKPTAKWRCWWTSPTATWAPSLKWTYGFLSSPFRSRCRTRSSARSKAGGCPYCPQNGEMRKSAFRSDSALSASSSPRQSKHNLHLTWLHCSALSKYTRRHQGVISLVEQSSNWVTGVTSMCVCVFIILEAAGTATKVTGRPKAACCSSSTPWYACSLTLWPSRWTLETQRPIF